LISSETHLKASGRETFKSLIHQGMDRCCKRWDRR
jgi:hypothetical protein